MFDHTKWIFIELRTYKDLVDAAERALAFENESTLSESQQHVSRQTNTTAIAIG